MNRARVAMAYQACEVADLAAGVLSLDDPAEAAEQAARVLAAAQRLVAAANRLGSASAEDPGDPLQRFADKHPEEAAEDITDWSLRHAFRGLTSELQG